MSCYINKGIQKIKTCFCTKSNFLGLNVSVQKKDGKSPPSPTLKKDEAYLFPAVKVAAVGSLAEANEAIDSLPEAKTTVEGLSEANKVGLASLPDEVGGLPAEVKLLAVVGRGSLLREVEPTLATPSSGWSVTREMSTLICSRRLKMVS